MALIFGDDRVEFKLRSVLGDYAGLAREMALMAEHGDVERIAKILEDKAGGIEKMKAAWSEALLIAMGEA